MSALLELWAGFGLTALTCDLVLGSRKLQAALGRVAVVHATGLGALVAVLALSHRMGVVPILIFWAGALLSWFGIRSHIESSILLRMIHMLRGSATTGRDLTSRYEAYYGKTQRIEELRRAGLLQADRGRGTLALTRKGLLIARVVLRLR